MGLIDTMYTYQREYKRGNNCVCVYMGAAIDAIVVPEGVCLIISVLINTKLRQTDKQILMN
jgi:hypothetical protein